MPVTAGELNRNNQETQHEADNTEKNVAPESRPETGDHKALNDLGYKKKKGAIDKKREYSQGKDIDRQSDQNDQGPQESINDAQYQSNHQCDRNAGNLYAFYNAGDDKDW